jgi:hypothetical protein
MKCSESFAESVSMFAGKWLAAPFMVGQDILKRESLFVRKNWPRVKALFSAWLATGDCQFSHEDSPKNIV